MHEEVRFEVKHPGVSRMSIVSRVNAAASLTCRNDKPNGNGLGVIRGSAKFPFDHIGWGLCIWLERIDGNLIFRVWLEVGKYKLMRKVRFRSDGDFLRKHHFDSVSERRTRKHHLARLSFHNLRWHRVL